MKKIKWISLLIFILNLIYLAPSSAVMIGFSPSSQTVNVGDAFNVDVVISDLYAADGSREIVSAFDLDVLYNSTVLNATGVTFGALLGANMSTDPFDIFSDALISSDLSSSGQIDFAALSFLSNADLLSLQPDSFTLATLSFDAIAEGVSSLIFDIATFPGVDVKGLDPSSPFDLSNTTEQGEVIIIASVPEPGIVWLMIMGLFSLGMAKRKNKC